MISSPPGSYHFPGDTQCSPSLKGPFLSWPLLQIVWTLALSLPAHLPPDNTARNVPECEPRWNEGQCPDDMFFYHSWTAGVPESCNCKHSVVFSQKVPTHARYLEMYVFPKENLKAYVDKNTDCLQGRGSLSLRQAALKSSLPVFSLIKGLTARVCNFLKLHC